MGKLSSLVTALAAVVGSAYYLEKKGILKITNEVKEDGSREIGLKIEKPEKPLSETIREDLKNTADEINEKANEFVSRAKEKTDEFLDETGLDDLIEDLDNDVTEAEKDINELLDELDKKD